MCRIIRIHICVIYVMVNTLMVFSQENRINEYQYSLSGIGIGQQKVTFLSPVFYKEIHFLSTNGKVVQTPDYYTSFFVETNICNNYRGQNKNYYSIGADINRNKYYPISIKNYPKIFPKIFIGWGYWLDADFFIKPDNTNNVAYYNFNNMLCFTLSTQKDFGIANLSSEFYIPILSIYSASEYSSSLPYFINHNGESLFQAFDIGYFNTEIQSTLKLNLDFEINRKKKIRTLRLQYSLASMVFNLNNNVKHNTFHTLSIGYLFNKNNYAHK